MIHIQYKVKQNEIKNLLTSIKSMRNCSKLAGIQLGFTIDSYADLQWLIMPEKNLPRFLKKKF